MDKRRLAREWLWLVGVFVAWIVFIVALVAFGPGQGLPTRDEVVVGFLVVYLVVAMVRLTIWAVKAARQ